MQFEPAEGVGQRVLRHVIQHLVGNGEHHVLFRGDMLLELRMIGRGGGTEAAAGAGLAGRPGGLGPGHGIHQLAALPASGQLCRQQPAVGRNSALDQGREQQFLFLGVVAAFRELAQELQHLSGAVGVIVGGAGGSLFAQPAEHAHGPLDGGVFGGQNGDGAAHGGVPVVGTGRDCRPLAAHRGGGVRTDRAIKDEAP